MATNSNIRPGIQKNPWNANLPYLRVPGLFAKWPMIGLTMIVVGGLIFGALAYSVQTNPALLKWDTATAKAMHSYLQNIPSALVEYLIFGFFIGREMIVVIGIVLGLYFLYKRFWREFAMVLIGSGGGGLLWYFLSRYFDRARPAFQTDIVLSDPSFPSGHTLSALVCYGFLAYLLVPKMPTRFWKWAIVILMAFVALFVGVSRLLLGGHYMTDVIAGYAVGLAWAGLVYTLVEKLFPTRESAATPVSTRDENTAQGLRSPGWFKRFPMIGLLLIIFGALSFGALGYNLMMNGPLVQTDQTVYQDLIVQAKSAPPRISELMIFGFFVGKQVILVIAAILIVYFLYKRYWLELAMLLLSSAAGSLVWNFFISYFARPRPPVQTGLAVRSIPSFPSGHTMSSIIVYGFLAYLLVPKMPSRFWKWTLIIATVLIILFDGFSRIYQGGHYLTDVLAGYALGIAWAALVYTVIEGIFIRRRNQNVEKI
jgi:membrane-associated phospholipid phosphatase